KARDWEAPGNLVDFITQVNTIRRKNGALQRYRTLKFYDAQNPNMLWYGKMTEKKDNVIFVAANLNPTRSEGRMARWRSGRPDPRPAQGPVPPPRSPSHGRPPHALDSHTARRSLINRSSQRRPRSRGEDVAHRRQCAREESATGLLIGWRARRCARALGQSIE